MPDTFSNARAYYDPTFPSSGDSFSISAMKNILQGLGFMDFLPLQPRAHSPADTKIMVRGRDASAFYNPVYAGDNNTRIFFNSGDSPAFSAPSSNPRLDIVYLTPSGDIRIVQGAEAGTPTLPSLSPSGDRLPICAVYNKVGQAKIVNFEDRNSNTGDGYIYQDLRPQFYSLAAGTQLTNTNPVSPTGDNNVGTATTAARSDHRHQGVHTAKLPGSGDLFGDIEIQQRAAIQAGNRITLAGVTVQKRRFSVRSVITPTATAIPNDNTLPQNTEGGSIDFTETPWIKPTNAANKLRITMHFWVSAAAGQGTKIASALFKDSGANSIDVGITTNDNNAVMGSCIHSVHERGAGDTNAQVYSVRIGTEGGDQVTINGESGAMKYGGALESYVDVEEYIPTF